LYNEVSAHLKHNNPDLVVEGHYHEADEPKPTIAKAVNMLYGFLLVTIIFGDKVFAALGMPMPGLLVQARENQMWSMFGIYYVGNLIAQNLMNTGAFEISYNGQMVWSKLESGRLPSWPELMAKMQSADSLAGGEPLHRLVMEQNAM